MTPKTIKKTAASIFSTPEASAWFEQLISHIQVDQLQLDLGVADKETSDFYQNAMAGNASEVFKKLRIDAGQFFIAQIVKAFLIELASRKAMPNKLAFSLSPSTILVWAEINDNDDDVEDNILLAEAKVNAFASQYDFSLDTMIVEVSDGLTVPNHYTLVK